jgi:hypothetical protein
MPSMASGKRWANYKFAFKEVFMQEVIHKELSSVVLKAAFAVHGSLGPGLLESVRHGWLRAVHSHGWSMMVKASAPNLML